MESINDGPKEPSPRIGRAEVAAVYQAERQDTSSLLSTSIAVTALTVAYLSALAFNRPALTDAALALAPAPLWAGSLYYQFLVRLMGAHGASMLALENALLGSSWDRNGDGSKRIGYIDGHQVGTRVGEQVITKEVPFRFVPGFMQFSLTVTAGWVSVRCIVAIEGQTVLQLAAVAFCTISALAWAVGASRMVLEHYKYLHRAWDALTPVWLNLGPSNRVEEFKSASGVRNSNPRE